MLRQLSRFWRTKKAIIAGTVVLSLFILAPAALSRPGGAVFQVTTPVVTVVATDNAAAEGGANTGAFRISRTGGTTGALTVNYSLSGTAGNGSDYTLLSSMVVIPANKAAATVTVSPLNDATPEGNETVILTVTSGTGYSVGSPSAATVTIDDNEKPAVSVVAADNAASESGPDSGSFTLSRTGATTNSLTVGYTLTGTAGNGSDYSVLATTVVIPAGQTSAAVTVTPIDDAISEPPETVRLTIALNSLYLIGSPSAATVTISDNDSPVVGITATDDTAAEAGSETGTFTVTRSGDLTTALTVNYLVGGSAANGADYASLSGSVVIAAGSASATVVITPVDDAIDEANEAVILTLAPGAGYTIGSPNSDTVTIADNDDPTPVPGTMPTSKDDCKKGGWQAFGVFKNQGDCVSWVATGGKNPPAG